MYEIQVEDWEADCHFGINKGRDRFLDGDYWEFSTIKLTGTILKPELKNAHRAVIRVSGDPRLDDHWNESPSEKPPLAIGFMQILRDNVTLEFFCSVPSRLVQYISVAVADAKIKHVSVYGERLKWRKGRIFDFTMSTNPEED